MLSPEVRDLRGVGADDNPSPNITDHGQQVRHTYALVAGLASKLGLDECDAQTALCERAGAMLTR